MDMTYVTVYPEEGNFPVIAKALLEAADHPGQVRSVSHPQAGFEVPQEVFDRFRQAHDPPEEQDAPVKRKPGRPRKNLEPEIQAPGQKEE